MLKVGLTGGIGSGKSSVARRLAAHGALVIDADAIAREVVEPGTPALAEIVAEFGDQVLTPEGRLDGPGWGRSFSLTRPNWLGSTRSCTPGWGNAPKS